MNAPYEVVGRPAICPRCRAEFVVEPPEGPPPQAGPETGIRIAPRRPTPRGEEAREERVAATPRLLPGEVVFPNERRVLVTDRRVEVPDQTFALSQVIAVRYAQEQFREWSPDRFPFLGGEPGRRKLRLDVFS